MIIDCHVHIFKTEKSERYFTLDTFQKLLIETNIEQALLMSNVSNIITEEELNNKLLQEIQPFNETGIYGRILLIPNFLNDKIVKQIKNNNIQGIKYHPSIHQTTVDNNSLFEYFEIMSSIPKTIIIVHCGRDRLSRIQYLINVSKLFPKCIFVGAHMGGNASELIEEAIDLVYEAKLENLYLDTSACKLPWLIEKAVNKIGSTKILFGSDEPYADLRISKLCIELANITNQEKENIFYNNCIGLIK